MKSPALSFIVLCLLLIGPVRADDIRLSSGRTASVLIELYTSEGCSSCPPAERFLNSFTGNSRLWTDYVPVAFHVDYWNDLGWKDRFSKPEYSQRQRRYAQIKRHSTVYTPAFIINGQHWRPGFYNKTIPLPDTPAPLLKLRIDEQAIIAELDADIAEPVGLQLNLALLGMGLESRITAGENRDKRARHEFVVLSHQQIPSTSLQWRLPLPKYSGEPIAAFAIAAWVSVPGDPAPLQAVGGPLPSAWVQ